MQGSQGETGIFARGGGRRGSVGRQREALRPVCSSSTLGIHLIRKVLPFIGRCAPSKRPLKVIEKSVLSENPGFGEPGGVWRTNSGSRRMPCTGPWFPTESELPEPFRPEWGSCATQTTSKQHSNKPQTLPHDSPRCFQSIPGVSRRPECRNHGFSSKSTQKVSLPGGGRVNN